MSEEVRLGALRFVAVPHCDGVAIRIFGAFHEPDGYYVSLAEWTSLQTVAQALVLADQRHSADVRALGEMDVKLGKERAEVERLRKIIDPHYVSPASGGPCVHSRPDWRMCPHCIGINVGGEQP